MSRSDDVFRKLRAFSFLTRLSLDDILARLSAEGSRHWGKGDSDSLGEYVRSGIDSGSLVEGTFAESSLKFFFEEDRCILDIRFESPAPSAEQEWNALLSYIKDRILPLVDAMDIRETRNYTS